MAVIEEALPNFCEFGLDDRLTNSIARLGWECPTLIQSTAIPHILEGKDVLARARTGSGKTGAFAIPAIQKVLTAKKLQKRQATRAVILAPSKELSSQLYRDFKALVQDCSRDISLLDVSQATKDIAPLVLERPDIIIGTPARIVDQMKKGNLDLSSLLLLVVDEADLLFSFGFDKDVKEFRRLTPTTGFQVVLMSATLSADVLKLKKLTLRNPVILKLKEAQLPPIIQLAQYHILVEEEEKFLLIYALFKLQLMKGKTLIFVKNVDRCYKVKLYLELFGIMSCVVNSELPAKSRCHIVSQFNSGLYDIVIASDETVLEETAESTKKKRRVDKESGISRGLDFQFVSNVINLDFPADVDSYIHRVGRTARGKNTGTAVSFVDHKEVPIFEEVQEYLKDMYGRKKDVSKPFKFNMQEVDSLRYRARDAFKSVTRIAVREARLKEIRSEILSSEKLKSHFEMNPNDYAVLRHDKALHTIKSQPHLKDVPLYIVPDSIKSNPAQMSSIMKANKKYRAEVKKADKQLKKRKESRIKLKRERDARNPLKTFGFEGFSKLRKKT